MSHFCGHEYGNGGGLGKRHGKSFAEVMVGRQRGQKALSDVVFSLISRHFVVKYFIFSR